MRTRFLVPAVAVVALLAFAACGDDDSPVGPPHNSTDRYVNANAGDDSNDGSRLSPWATITHAVATVDTGITIRVSPGTYNEGGGETFPIVLKKGQKLIGNVPDKGAGPVATLVQGQGAHTFGVMTEATIVGADGAFVTGFTIDHEAYAVGSTGIVLDGGYMDIGHNTLGDNMYTGVTSGNGAHLFAHDNLIQASSYGLFVDGSSIVWVHDNDFEGESYGMRAFNVGSMIVQDNTIAAVLGGVQGGFGTDATITHNTFNKTTAGDYGSIIAVSGTPVIRFNTFTGGTAIWVQDTATPNAGTDALQGSNDFSGVTGPAIRHSGSGVVQAVGNTWVNNPPQAGVDYEITGGGTIVTQ